MASQSDLIRDGYNQMATKYANERGQLRSDRYLRKLEQVLPKQASLLDLGCGDGRPVAEFFLKKGYLVTGLDISNKQIELARKNNPRGDFQVKNIEDLKPGDYFVDGILSFYTIFHIPRAIHGKFLKTLNTFLPIGGWLLITMGDKDFEGFHQLYGEKVWSSHFGPAKNAKLVKEAGFEIITDELDTSGREKHQIILAQKNKNIS